MRRNKQAFISGKKVKNTLLRIVTVVMAACCGTSCIREFPENPASDSGIVSLTFDLRVLGFDTRSVEQTAERIGTLRIVIVDLGIDNQGRKVAEASIERNILMKDVSLAQDPDAGLPAGVARLQFPKIRADRRKKIYLLINAEPTKQAYLDLRLEDGTKISSLGANELFLPDGNGNAPIEEATFVSPQGSYGNNDIRSGEELLVPMTGFHTLSIPSIEELVEKYPTIQSEVAYSLPSQLYAVRAINKITFEFVNRTYSPADHLDGIDLLIRQWSLSQINTQSSYLFGHPGENGDLFSGRTCDLFENVNAPWMQWLKDEAEKSQSPDYKPDYQWLTEYSLPADASHGTLSFRRGAYTGSASEGQASDNDGYVLPAPTNSAGVSLSTENEPVYFSESHPGNPQQYELAFTVWQRTAQQKENGISWNTPYTYRAKSAITAQDDGKFCLQSLFRSTHVVVRVVFRSGVEHPEVEVDVHPYGSYYLEPDFGL